MINYRCLYIHRLSYGEWVLEGLIEKNAIKNIYVMYDIACMLHKHLEVCVIVRFLQLKS